MKSLYKIPLALVAVCFMATPTHAQQENVTVQRNAQEWALWGNSQNAAGLLKDPKTKKGLLELGWENVWGDFKRPQMAQSDQLLSMKTLGNMNIKNTYVEGYFNYGRNEKKDVLYNASLIDPLRNMPYMVADTNASDWINQHYHLGFSVATPLADRWQLGLSVDYEAVSGAKQRDIRANNFQYGLELKPGLVFTSGKHSLGANLLYRNFKEESTNSNVNFYYDQGFFNLYGLGRSVAGIGSGQDATNYMGDAFGGGLQYLFEGAWDVMVNATYETYVEDAHITFTSQRTDGTILNETLGGGLTLQKQSTTWHHKVGFGYENSASRGIEYINQFESGLESPGWIAQFRSVRSTYDRQNLHADYVLLSPASHGHDWRIQLSMNYHELNDRYLIPSSAMYSENIGYGVSLDRGWSFEGALDPSLYVGIGLQGSQNLNGYYDYKGSHPQSLIVTDLEAKNSAYYNAEYVRVQLPIVYNTKLRASHDTHLFLKLNTYYTLTSDFMYQDRQRVSFSIGTVL